MALGPANNGQAVSAHVNVLLELPVVIKKPVEHTRVLLLREVSPGNEPALMRRQVTSATRNAASEVSGGEMTEGVENEEGEIAAAVAAAALDEDEKKEPRAVQASHLKCVKGLHTSPATYLYSWFEHAATLS